MTSYHIPVLVKEAIDGLQIKAGKKYIDATIGGAGHGIEIVKRGGILLGLDTDRDAVEHAKEELRTQCLKFREEKDWKVVQGNFRDIERIAKENWFRDIDGILFDLGISSYQLDTAKRGFSYRFTDAPLDLRLDQSTGETAAQLVNRMSAEELYEIFTRFAEEELAGPISHRIVRTRAVSPIRTTGDLMSVIDEVVKDLKKRNATYSRVFQALRISVNDELGALKRGLLGAQRLLNKNGRLAVITFHSLEDRIVKQFMQTEEWRVITHKPIIPSREEQKENSRSRSAKLRIAEKI